MQDEGLESNWDEETAEPQEEEVATHEYYEGHRYRDYDSDFIHCMDVVPIQETAAMEEESEAEKTVYYSLIHD